MSGFAYQSGPIAQLVEHSADNAGVRGAIPLWPTIFSLPRSGRTDPPCVVADKLLGPVAQLVERLLCKQEVSGSRPLRSTKLETPPESAADCFAKFFVL